MTSAATPTLTAKTLYKLLTFIVAVVGLLAGSINTASATTALSTSTSSGVPVDLAPETRVGVAATPAGLFVGPQAPGGPTGIRKIGCAYDGTTVGSCVATKGVAGAADDVVGAAKPWDLQRTETLAGKGSQAKVDQIAGSMRANGWSGAPIEVFEVNGQKYIANGHHRVAAARQAGVDVQYRVISEAELRAYYPGGPSQLVSAASEARPGKVR